MPDTTSVKVIDFIKNDKTIIIDLSILKELDQQVFITFVIIGKFIHYMDTFKDYTEKVLAIPRIDLFFDTFYLERNSNHCKVDKFLEPLLSNDFGLICQATQIKNLHPNVFNFFNNYITFKTIDSMDIHILENALGLQELHGRGYYSSSRNNTYQLEYLKSMKPNEIIMKRIPNL